MAAGRPLELSRDIIQQVEKLLPRALYVETVAGHIGVHRTTFTLWLRQGSREQRRRDRGCEPDSALDLHCELSVTVKKTLAAAECDYLSVIQAAGADAWTALAWILERRFPDRWANNRGELKALAKQIAALATQGVKGAESPRTTEAPDKPAERGPAPSVESVE